MSNKVIAISGGSGSGKTTIANMLKLHYADQALLLSLDSYYKDLSHLDEYQRSIINFDHPDSQDINQLYKDIIKLKNGESVFVPEYCFETHTRKVNVKKVESCPVILLEGMYSFFDMRLESEADIKIFVDVSPDIRLIRRVRRDMLERARTVESILSQYEETVRSMHIEFIEKQKEKADIVIRNDSINNLQALVDVLIKEIN